MRKPLLVSLLLLSGQHALAQDLNLFEQTEADLESQPNEQAQRITVNANSQPAFTLRGTSRFGDQHHMVLVARSGEVVKLSWRDGEQVAIPGYTGFQVMETDARQVTLRHPDNDSCFNAEELGVQCTDGNVAVLSLSTAQPLQTNGTAGVNTVNAVPGMDPGAVVTVDGQQVFINPFSGEPEVQQQMSEEERIAREERRRARAERLQQFQAVRIEDADIPPGMRRVRTPFGDRLVPERE